MRLTIILSLLATPPTLALPWLRPEGLEALFNHPEAQAEIQRRLQSRDAAPKEPRQRVAGLVTELTGLLGDSLKIIQDPIVGLIPTHNAVKGLKRLPEAKYPFQPPGPTDQRGPCPGMNTLANHGYIPRNGIATVRQIQAATEAVFNMGADLSALLSVGGALAGGDILSMKMSIGGPDDRVGLLNGALNSLLGTPSGIGGHNKITESDASATRLDFYLEGDNMSFRPELFKQMHKQALAVGNGTYNFNATKAHFKNRYAASRAANPQFYFNVPSAMEVLSSYYFIPALFSNGTIGAGGIANEASVTSFYGAKPARDGAWNDPDLEYTRVPERIPEQGWYRRATPMTITEAVAGMLEVYEYARPAFGGAGANETWVAGPLMIPNNPQAIGCFLYNAIYASLPSELFKSVSMVETLVNSLSSLLSPGYKALGCTTNFPEKSGLDPNSYDKWAQTYVGEAKTKALGSPWYKKT